LNGRRQVGLHSRKAGFGGTPIFNGKIRPGMVDDDKLEKEMRAEPSTAVAS